MMDKNAKSLVDDLFHASVDSAIERIKTLESENQRLRELAIEMAEAITFDPYIYHDPYGNECLHCSHLAPDHKADCIVLKAHALLKEAQA